MIKLEGEKTLTGIHGSHGGFRTSAGGALLENRQVLVLLSLVVGAAFVLRFWGIWFGLPYSFRADEYHEVFRALELGTGNFNFERTGKGGYFYLLFVEYGILYVVLKAAGIVSSAQDFATYFVRDQSIFYLLGRATTAVIGTLNVYLAYRVGARAYGVAAGLFAATILCFDFLNAEHSHFITVDVPVTCLVTAALLFGIRMVTEDRAADYKWAAFFAALATTTKLPGALVLLPLLIAHGFVVLKRGGGIRGFFLSRDLLWALGIFAVVLGVTNPGIFLYPPLVSFGGEEAAALAEDELIDAASAAPNLYLYYWEKITYSLGWPLMLVCLGGFLYALWKRTISDVMLVSFAALYFWVFASVDSHLYFPRYMLPLIVVLALLGGRLLSVAWPPAGGPKQAVAAALVVAAAALPASRIAANDYLLTQTDTRQLAAEWFQENVPDGAKVVIEGLKIEPSRLTVPLRDTPENMRANIAYYKEREPGKAVYLRHLLKVDHGRTYDLELAKRSDLQTLQYYKNAGAEYLVIRPQALTGLRRNRSAGHELLDALEHDPDVHLIKRFESDPRSRPGPVIEIWQVDRNADGLGL